MSNRKSTLAQQLILVSSAIAIILMVLFPPTQFDTYEPVNGRAGIYSGYQFIGALKSSNEDIQPLQNPDYATRASIYKIEPVRLTFQIVGLLIVTGLLYIAFQRKH
ncbi:MAG: hypothetical protein WEA58_11510 [Balneolaceae bacterium]